MGRSHGRNNAGENKVSSSLGRTGRHPNLFHVFCTNCVCMPQASTHRQALSTPCERPRPPCDITAHISSPSVSVVVEHIIGEIQTKAQEGKHTQQNEAIDAMTSQASQRVFRFRGWVRVVPLSHQHVIPYPMIVFIVGKRSSFRILWVPSRL